jgi:uncharacterized protein
MRYKVKDIGEGGLDLLVPITTSWLTAECSEAGVQLAPGGAQFKGRLESAGESFLLRGELNGALRMPCGRCLEEAQVPLEVPITVTYAEADGKHADLAEDDEQDDADVLFYEDGVIDLSNELRDEILLALPIAPVCQEACAGICPVCGGNRNNVPCDCEEKQRLAASKFAALQDLKKNLKV